MQMKSEAINELATALSKAQANVETALEDKQNPHFRSHYASLNSVWQACRSALSNNGLSVSQITDIEGDMLVLNTYLMHSSGQWIRSRMPIISVKTTPQAIGSAVTYMRRYTLAAIVGVAPGDDDDGNAAEDKSGRDQKFVRYQIPVPTQKPDGYDEFIETMNLRGNKESAYLAKLVKETNRTEMQIIKAAMKNPDGFKAAYEKWQEDGKD